MRCPSASSKWAGPAAIVLWLTAFTAILVSVALHPLKHTTMPPYRLASVQWWAGQDIYSMRSHDSFFYFPQAAILFSPFAFTPGLCGEVFWRGTVFALFAYGLLRVVQVFLQWDRSTLARPFFFLSLLAVPSSLASLRNAQFDLPLAALILLAAAEIGAQRWTLVAVLLCLAVALKPLGLVPLLLFSALFWKLIPRVALGLLLLLALPFLHWSPSYAAHEYVRCAQALFFASQPGEPRFSDLAALTSHFHLVLTPAVQTVLRLLFALIYLGLGAVGVRRLPLFDAGWLVGALSADYLMLFNPRTETCSFVILGGFTASLALRYAVPPGRRIVSFFLGFASLCLACDGVPVLHGYTDRWLKPLVALLFLPLLLQFIFENRAPRRP